MKMVSISNYVIVIFLVFKTVFMKDVENIVLDSDEERTWSTSNPYNSNESVIVTAESGYLISVIVSECDIEGDTGDFLLIKSDHGSGRVFTYNLNTERKYLVHDNSLSLNFVVLGDNSNNRAGASVTFQRYGEQVTTTTQSAITTTNYPTPGENETGYITVNVSGKAYVDYGQSEVLNNFKTAVVSMATAYCIEQNIILLEDITISNVQINSFAHCQFFWPDSDRCAKITFSVPVFFNETESSWKGYQLASDNLLSMWNTLGPRYLAEYGFSIYSIPNENYAILLWILAIIGAILVLFIVLLVVKRFRRSGAATDKFSSSDTTSEVSRKRASDLSLSPHPLQSTPQLFENDYALYEPSVSPPYANVYSDNPSYQFDDDDDDDESDEEIDIPIHFTATNGIDSPVRESET